VGLLAAAVSDASGKRGEAAVRDAGDSIEVIAIQLKDGGFYTLPFLPGGGVLLSGAQMEENLADSLAGYTLKLPPVLTAPWKIEQTIAALEQNNQQLPPDWQSSPWLKDELFLVLDENNSAQVGDYRLTYHQELGLRAERIVKNG
jgi:CRISPR-associated endonuclease/helicase Cas3